MPAAGRPAPEDANMEAAESSAGQPTSSVVRTLEAEDDTSAKRQRSTWTRTSWSFCRRCPDDQGQWTQRVIDWDKKYHGAKSGNLLDPQEVCEGRLRELANIEKLEVAEPIQLQESRAQNPELRIWKLSTETGWTT